MDGTVAHDNVYKYSAARRTLLELDQYHGSSSLGAATFHPESLVSKNACSG